MISKGNQCYKFIFAFILLPVSMLKLAGIYICSTGQKRVLYLIVSCVFSDTRVMKSYQLLKMRTHLLRYILIPMVGECHIIWL